MRTALHVIGQTANIFTLAVRWQRGLYCMFSGALAACALPPLDFLFCLPVALCLLVWLLDGAINARRTGAWRVMPAILAGWCFGFAWHLVGLFWIGEAFLIDAPAYAVYAPYRPFAIILLAAFLGLFMALATLLCHFFWSDGWQRIPVLAASLTLSDALRGSPLVDFSWNSWAITVTNYPVILQGASLGGLEGLGFFLVLCAAAPALLADERVSTRFLALLATLAAALLVFGAWRIDTHTYASHDDIALRLVQPSVSQAEKWRPENRIAIFDRMAKLSARPWPEDLASRPVKIILWPEVALPAILSESGFELEQIAQLLPGDTLLVTGALRRRADYGDDSISNSVYAIDGDGEIRFAYDKMTLVPFGEYLPFQETLSQLGIAALVPTPGSFVAGNAAKNFTPAGVPPFMPLICYEITFPQRIVKNGVRPQWLVNLTNDAWFGETAGPFQHIAHARAAAVALGLPVIRVANTGISAVIGPLGGYQAVLALNEMSTIDVLLPTSVGQTFYARYAEKYDTILLFAVTILCFVMSRLDGRVFK